MLYMYIKVEEVKSTYSYKHSTKAFEYASYLFILVEGVFILLCK